MPRVPTYDSSKVAPPSAPSINVAAPITPEAAGINAKQFGQLGQSVQGLGQELFKIQMDAANVRATDAANRFQAELNKQMYGDPNQPGSGILNQRGINAFKRGPNGDKDLYSEAEENVNQVYSKLTEELSDDTQRGMFSAKIRDIKNQHFANITRHQANEWNNYQVSVAEDSIKNAQTNMGINYRSKDILDRELESIRGAVSKISNIKGTQGSVESDTRRFTSNSLKEAGKMSLFNKDISGARAIMRQYKDSFEANDLLELDTLTRQVELKAIDENFGNSIQKWALPKVNQDELSRAANIISEGAADQEKEKIKEEFAKAYMNLGGDKRAAIMAFAPGMSVEKVKMAMTEAEKNNRGIASEDKKQAIDFIPQTNRQEIEKYIADKMTKLDMGLGAGPLPTVKQAKDYADQWAAQMGIKPTPELRKLLHTTAEARLTDLYQSKKQEDDNIAATAVQYLVRPEVGGEISKIPLDVMAPAYSRPDALKKIQDAADGYKKTYFDYDTYLKIKDDAQLAKMSKDELILEIAKLPQSERTSALSRWTDLKQGKSESSVENIDFAVASQQFDLNYQILGKDPTPKATKAQQEVAQNKATFFQALTKEQQRVGKKLSDVELSEFAKGYFNKQVMANITQQKQSGKFPYDWKEEVVGQVPKLLRNLKIQDIDKAAVARIKLDFLQNGNYEPSEEEILNTYKTLMLFRQKEDFTEAFKKQKPKEYEQLMKDAYPNKQGN